MALVVSGAAIAIGALVSVAVVTVAGRTVKRGAARDAAVVRGLRRGAMAGCIVGLAALLRALDGLTPLTVVFVAAPFIVAEVVLSTRRA